MPPVSDPGWNRGMNKTLRNTVVGIALLASLALSGCSSSGDSEQETFDFEGTTLNVSHGNTTQSVTVSASADLVGEVTVEVSTQTLGQSPQTPAWSLSSDGTLTLDTPCGGNWIGYCEASWSIVVPEGTEVFVDGQQTAVR